MTDLQICLFGMESLVYFFITKGIVTFKNVTVEMADLRDLESLAELVNAIVMR